MTEPKDMNLSDAECELQNKVYEACRLLEQLEYCRSVLGNGHHMRQKVAEFARDLLCERWVKKEENNGH